MVLISAKEAREMTELAGYNKQADELLKPITADIKLQAKLGGNSLTVNNKEWYKTVSPTHKLAILKLQEAGYVVADNEYQYAPNGGQPDDYYGINITW